MDHSAFALPILPGKTAAARAFQEELEGRRKGEYTRSERARGIVKELWFLQETPAGDLFVVYLESPDVAQALDQFAASRDGFDVWFKQQLAHVTGIDMNISRPGPLSQLMSCYECATQDPPTPPALRLPASPRAARGRQRRCQDPACGHCDDVKRHEREVHYGGDNTG